MRTIIPFPRLQLLPPHEARGRSRAEAVRDASLEEHSVSEMPLRVPEGENRVPAISSSARAQAMHSQIVSLIRAVHHRFG